MNLGQIGRTELSAARAFTVSEFCAAFRLSKPSVYRVIASGELHSVVRCGRRLIPNESAEKWWAQEAASPLMPSRRNKYKEQK
jgi:excisionase family DNA binding protein